MSALLREVAALLWDAGETPCAVAVERADDGLLTLTVAIRTDPDLASSDVQLAALELYHELRYLADISQMRDLASRYDIDAAKLEALLPKERI